MGHSGVPTHSEVCHKTPMCLTNSDPSHDFSKYRLIRLIFIYKKSSIFNNTTGSSSMLCSKIKPLSTGSIPASAGSLSLRGSSFTPGSIISVFGFLDTVPKKTSLYYSVTPPVRVLVQKAYPHVFSSWGLSSYSAFSSSWGQLLSNLHIKYTIGLLISFEARCTVGYSTKIN